MLADRFARGAWPPHASYPNPGLDWAPKAGAEAAPNAGVLLAPNPKPAELAAPKAGAGEAPNAGAEVAPNAGVLVAPKPPKAGALVAPNAGEDVAPNAGVLVAPNAGAAVRRRVIWHDVLTRNAEHTHAATDGGLAGHGRSHSQFAPAAPEPESAHQTGQRAMAMWCQRGWPSWRQSRQTLGRCWHQMPARWWRQTRQTQGLQKTTSKGLQVS